MDKFWNFYPLHGLEVDIAVHVESCEFIVQRCRCVFTVACGSGAVTLSQIRLHYRKRVFIVGMIFTSTIRD